MRDNIWFKIIHAQPTTSISGKEKEKKKKYIYIYIYVYINEGLCSYQIGSALTHIENALLNVWSNKKLTKELEYANLIQITENLTVRRKKKRNGTLFMILGE